jgi:NitT/TauT family transport system substrate-binding protein
MLKRHLRKHGVKALVLAAAMAMPAAAEAEDVIMYGIPGPATTAVANLTFAMELGFFEEEGISVELIPLSGSAVIIPQLLSGDIHISGASIDPVIVSRDPGKPNFPVKFVYNLNRNMIWQFAVPVDSEYETMAHLEGVNMGVSSLAANNIPHQAMLRASGVDPESVTFQAVGIGASAWEALRTGEVDVLGLWDVAHAGIEALGGEIRRLPMPEEFLGRATHGFEVSDEFLEENPDLIARFGRAAAKGTVACLANEIGCLHAFWNVYPELKPQTGTEEEIVERELAAMQARLTNQTYFPEGVERRWGEFSDEDFTMIIDGLAEAGLISTRDIPLESLYTNEFVDEYNDFDEAEVIEKAENYAW